MELGLLPTTLIGMVMKSVLSVSTLSFELTDLRPLLQCVWVMIIARKGLKVKVNIWVRGMSRCTTEGSGGVQHMWTCLIIVLFQCGARPAVSSFHAVNTRRDRARERVGDIAVRTQGACVKFNATHSTQQTQVPKNGWRKHLEHFSKIHHRVYIVSQKTNTLDFQSFQSDDVIMVRATVVCTPLHGLVQITIQR